MSKKLFHKRSGIYQVRNLVNWNIYVGQTTDLATRRYSHFRLLNLQQHHTPHLQSAYNKYGAENFVFEVLTFCDIDSLDYFEQQFVNKLKPKYNSRLEVTSNRGHKMSEETKRRISESQKGKVISEEARKNMSLAHIGNKMTPEQIQNMSQRLKGHSFNKGRKQPAEEVEKRAKALREHWKTHTKTVSDEARAKMSASATGIHLGQSNGNSRLTANSVSEIRRLHKSKSITLNGIADKFGVSQTTIVSICMRRTWKHVE